LKRLFSAVFIFILVFSSCSANIEEGANLVFPDDIEMTAADFGVTVHVDHVTFSSYEGMIAHSGLIVLGHFTEELPERYSLAKYESGGLDPIGYKEGLKYNFVIEKVLKGDYKGESVPVVLSYGYRKNADSKEIMLDSGFYKPDYSGYSILFIDKGIDVDVYFPSSVPYELFSKSYNPEKSEGNVTFELKTNSDSVKDSFKTSSIELNSVIKELNTASN
jgi:hypothetical protein